MTPVYKTTDALLSDYNSLPEIEQNRVGKYLKNLVRIQKASRALNFADKQVQRELNKHITPYAGGYSELDDISCSFCGKPIDEAKKIIAGLLGIYICDECVGLCNEILEEEIGKK